ncbi:MAG: heme exporter protein CcmB [Spirochaetes bacterium]|nr:heme exporter protein CcmB [Spirochaetota bacterium]
MKTESHYKNNVFRNLQKDYRIEFRNKYAFNLSVSFAVISTLAISLTAGGAGLSVKIQAVLLWIILFFSGMNGLSHIFIRETEQDTDLFLRLVSTPETVLASKLLFNIFLFFILQIITVPLFILFLNIEIKALIAFIAGAVAGGIAIASSTSILAAITSMSGGKSSLFTVISFPVILPVLWVASDSTANSLSNADYTGCQNIIFLLAFSVLITAVSFILFNYIWAEE